MQRTTVNMVEMKLAYHKERRDREGRNEEGERERGGGRERERIKNISPKMSFNITPGQIIVYYQQPQNTNRERGRGQLASSLSLSSTIIQLTIVKRGRHQ